MTRQTHLIPKWSPLLRVPPFPGARVRAIAHRATNAQDVLAVDPQVCLDALRRHRVGGSFWAAQPKLDPASKLIARPSSDLQARAMIVRAEGEGLRDRLLFWLPEGVRPGRRDSGDIPVIEGDCDPWHMFDHADTLWIDAGDEIALLAAIAGCPTLCFAGDSADMADRRAPDCVARHVIGDTCYVDPFNGAPIDASAAIELLGLWRTLIDSNRPIAAAVGFARWKRPTVEPLLWNGSDPVRFMPATSETLRDLPPGAALAIWKARVPSEFLAVAETGSIKLREVEDGFIRSSGLGANCVPPLSIVVDAEGAHFDPRRPSALETLLETAEFSSATIAQANELRDMIRQSGLSKYETGGASLSRPGGQRRHVLVPGQVEDDRSVLLGGGGIDGNLGLLRRVRALEPDAFIIYKPHPDVEAGHRKGHVTEGEARPFADAIMRDASISSLLDMVDAIHVLTSLAGFEALLRDKPVTTHGVPFYAGWGLTTDLGAVPSRRTRRRTVAELIAAVLMAYPRYLDPVTLLPCPPDILVHRLATGMRKQNEAIVSLRRFQGVLRRTFSRIGAAA